MQRLRICFVVITLLASALSPVTAIRAGDINDARALADVKTAKGIFLVDIGDPTGIECCRGWVYFVDRLPGARLRIDPDVLILNAGSPRLSLHHG